ncbi:hypothetical protein GCM10027074_01060 [Streptomyces deserti]
MVRAARPAFPRHLVYGDYSVEHAFSANIPHSKGPGHAETWIKVGHIQRMSFVVRRLLA